MSQSLEVRLDATGIEAGSVQVRGLSGTEEISRLFSLEVTVEEREPGALDELAVLCKPASQAPRDLALAGLDLSGAAGASTCATGNSRARISRARTSAARGSPARVSRAPCSSRRTCARPTSARSICAARSCGRPRSRARTSATPGSSTRT